MDLFGIGFGEIVLILIVALMIFGPGKLPEIGRTIGRFSRNLKKMSSEFTTAMTKEIDMEEEQKNLKKMAADLKTDITTGLSLGDEPRSHLNLNKTQPQTPFPTAESQPPNSPAGPQTSPPAVKHD
jgi:sec-independent protein translocase protein TatA